MNLLMMIMHYSHYKIQCHNLLARYLEVGIHRFIRHMLMIWKEESGKKPCNDDKEDPIGKNFNIFGNLAN